MRMKVGESIAALIIGLSMSAAQAVAAQPPSGTMQQTKVSEHHELQFRLMKDMSQVMSGMGQEMSSADLTPLQRQQMAQRMQRMSNMMDLMSGWTDRPAMNTPEMQRQMDQMRTQMNEMMHEMMATPALKPNAKK